MMLHCTLVQAPGSGPARAQVELSIRVAPGLSGRHLQAALSRRYGTGELYVRGRRLTALSVGESPLVNGAVIVDGFAGFAGPPRRAVAGEPAAGLVLAVHGGPAAGTIITLPRGQFRIGRSGTDIVIPDAGLSRNHALLDVSDAAVTLTDLDSANGTFVDGRKIRACAVTTASTIRCGDSTLSLALGTGPDSSGAAAAGLEAAGLAAAGGSVAEPIVLRNHVAQVSRAGLVLTAVLPLLAGVGLAVFTGMWIFLAFTAVSAVWVLVPAVSGRRQRRELTVAVAAAALQDRQRRYRAAPSAADLAASEAAGRPSSGTPDGASSQVCLRLGLAEQPANLRLEPPLRGFLPPGLGAVPLVLDPAAWLVTVRGPRDAVHGLVRFVIMQLAGYPLACRTRVLVVGGPESLPIAARFLPGVLLSADPTAATAWLAAGPGEGFDDGLLIILDPGGSTACPSDGPEAPPPDVAGSDTAGQLRAAAAGHGWRVLDCVPGTGPGTDPAVLLGERCGRLTAGGTSIAFVPDLVPLAVFDKFCRALGAKGRTGPALPSTVPDRCVLTGILPLDEAAISRRWSRARQSPGLSVPVGAGAGGTVHLDLQKDGPHLLVAGTTGSGKSEFLRTLAAGLAAGYPPDRVNLLFIDFKGGSGLGPLTGLPHCVGMLTDLGVNDVGRAVVSLRAEVRRREQLLAAAQAPDLTTYESLGLPGPRLPHLVIIIDEFRVLVEDAPVALSELMRIAAIGRSLGIHLVMATQRPQGAVTADIRANVTSCIALRVQSGSESFDVMNSPLAAGIPLNRPGRAFLTRGNGASVEFQTATLGPAEPPGDGSESAIFVEEARDVLLRQPAALPPVEGDSGGGGRGRSAAPTPAQAALPLVEASSRLWQSLAGALPRRPVADPLPALLPFPDPAESPLGPCSGGPATGAGVGPAPPDTVRLGWVDLPEQQRVAGLNWSPGTHGHLGLVGGTTGAADAALAVAVEQLLSGPAESHVYVLDAAGAFAASTACPRIGAVAGLPELRRAVRVLERLADELTLRGAGPLPADAPPLVLVIGGWGSWVSAFRAGPLSWAEDLVVDIVRDGFRCGLTVIVSGERELVTARFFAAIPNRVFLPMGSTDEGRLGWPRMPVLDPVPGRVAVYGAFVENSSVSGPATSGHAGQLFEPKPAHSGGRAGWPVRVKPFRVDALPALITVAELRILPDRADPDGRLPPAATLPPSPARRLVCVGVGGDELVPVRIPVRTGGVLAVLGGAGAGKSTLLAALPDLNPGLQFLLAPGPGMEPELFWSDLHAKALDGTLDRAAILLADDLDRQPPEANNRLLTLNGLGWSVIFTAAYSPSLQQRIPLILNARSHGQGILIRPRSPMDGDLFGVRFGLEAGPPPGRAVVISEGSATPVQLATPGTACRGLYSAGGTPPDREA